MNMCFGAKNSDDYRREKNDRFVDESSSAETKNDRKTSSSHAKASESVLHDKNKKNPEEARSGKCSNNSEKSLPSSEKKLRIFESEKSLDGTFDPETNIVRTFKRCVGEKKSGKIARSETRNKIIRDQSSNGEKNRGTKDFGVKNSEKFADVEKRMTETERFVGDGLSLRMEVNERDIEVTGDGCRLTLATNRGRIRMIGDGCRLQIGRNSGDIEYTGDGGRVSLGPDSTGTKVHYVGEGGRVDIADGKGRAGPRYSTTSGRGVSSNGFKCDNEQSPEIIDNIFNERRARQTSKSTCKTVRIVNIDTKIITNGITKSSVRAQKSYTQCV